ARGGEDHLRDAAEHRGSKRRGRRYINCQPARHTVVIMSRVRRLIGCEERVTPTAAMSKRCRDVEGRVDMEQSDSENHTPKRYDALRVKAGARGDLMNKVSPAHSVFAEIGAFWSRHYHDKYSTEVLDRVTLERAMEGLWSHFQVVPRRRAKRQGAGWRENITAMAGTSNPEDKRRKRGQREITASSLSALECEKQDEYEPGQILGNISFTSTNTILRTLHHMSGPGRPQVLAPFHSLSRQHQTSTMAR
ncbi:hypothetical protein B0H14DRAFT_3771449, partial [Mycena olivaceomarginata]